MIMNMKDKKRGIKMNSINENVKVIDTKDTNLHTLE